MSLISKVKILFFGHPWNDVHEHLKVRVREDGLVHEAIYYGYKVKAGSKEELNKELIRLIDVGVVNPPDPLTVLKKDE